MTNPHQEAGDSPAALTSPHAMETASVAAALQTTVETGLTASEAKARLMRFGPNQLARRRPAGFAKLLRHQFESPVVLLLVAAGAVAFTFGEWKEGIAIGLVLLVNGAIGLFTELRAARSMEALRQLGDLTTRVRRDGRTLLVSGKDLVPGDIAILEGGDIVTADLRLAECSNLFADESALTGESLGVEKALAPTPADSSLGDRTCMAYKGTSIARGTGVGIVVATGLNTELGLISKLVEEARPEQSPLEKQLQKLSGQLVKLTLVIVAIIAAVGVLQGGDDLLVIEASIALAVAAIPEGLPVVATLALARGMWRMAQKNALIECLSAVETLGATTAILTDKTGTLTQDRMVLQEINCGGVLFKSSGNAAGFQREAHEGNDSRDCLTEILSGCVLCNNAELSLHDGKHVGDPLEQALLLAGQEEGVERSHLESRFPRMREIAFDSTTKLMGTIHRADDTFVMWVKGAPEEVLDACSEGTGQGGEPVPMTPDLRALWKTRTDELAARGLRVLAVAKRNLSAPDAAGYAELSFVGLLGLNDPPRADVADAIALCRSAGIRVVMLTGDHVATAKTIAMAVGLMDGTPQVMEGRALRPITEMSEDELATLHRTDIFARVSPAQKLDLVTLFQDRGDIVAMTGDGVNDAPALKQADIGVAMGVRGTQVAREAAAMVLRDDAFGTIVTAIREGRVIFRNIQKFVTYLLSCNLSEVLIVGTAILIGLPLPLMPLQILFLNLVTDVFPAFALGFGEGGKDMLNRPPRDPRKPMITRPIWVAIVLHSLTISGATLGAFILAQTHLFLTVGEAVTVAFFTLAFSQLWHVFNMRDPRSGLILNEITRNRFVWAALLVSGCMLLLAMFLPVMASPLDLEPLSLEAWLLVAGMSFVPLLIGQVSKWILRQRR